MQYTTTQIGRTLIARLEDGESIYAEIEKLAEKEKVLCATVLALGGIRRGAVVTGPKEAKLRDIEPMVQHFDDARELVGIGSLFPADGKPMLHFHAGIGRGETALVGCPREEAVCFLVLEVFIIEWVGADARRELDPESGLKLLKLARAL
ncbi:DNA-binding protein [bacterium]|nr:DNA-binding protein [bacterium]